MVPPYMKESLNEIKSGKRFNTPEEKEYYTKQKAALQEMARRQMHTRKIRAGDLVSYMKNASIGKFYGLVIETKIEEETTTYDGETSNVKYARIQWSQKIPEDAGVPDNEDWWFSLNSGLWKLINR